MIAVGVTSLLVLMAAFVAGRHTTAVLHISGDRVLTLLSGLAVLSGIGMFASLFVPINGWFPAGLLFFVLISFTQKPVRQDVFDALSKVKYALLVSIPFLVAGCYAASGFPVLYDTGLYHLQAVKWMQAFPAVPGLANLHQRLGVNSSSFVLEALADSSFLFGKRANVMAFSFFTAAVVFLLNAVIRAFKEADVRVAAVQSVLFIAVILEHTALSSASPDTLSTLLVLLLLSRFLQTNQPPPPIAAVVFLSAFAVTIKLSLAPLVLLPLLLLFRERPSVPDVLKMSTLALLLVLPWVARNIILTGWVVFPFTGIDLIHSDWKFPFSLASFLQLEISMWPKYPGVEAEFAELYPAFHWIPAWFERQTSGTLLLLTGAVLSPLAVLAAGVKRKLPASLFPLALTCWAGAVYWFLLAPDIRFGKIYLMGACAAGLFALLSVLPSIPPRFHASVVPFGFFGVIFISSIMLIRGTGALGMPKTLLQGNRWLVQEPHPASVNLRFYAVPVSGGSVFVPVADERCFDGPVPCTSGVLRNLEFRGSDLGFGFRFK